MQMKSEKSSQLTIKYELDPSEDQKIYELQKRMQDYQKVSKIKKSEAKKGILKSNIFDKDNHQRSNFVNILKNVRKDSIVQQFINKLKINNSKSSLNYQDECQYFSIGKTSHEEDFRRKIKEGKVFKFQGYQKINIITVILKLLILLSLFFTTTLKLTFEQVPPLNQVANFIIIFSYALLILEALFMINKIQTQKKIKFLSNLYFWVQYENQTWWIILHLILFLNAFEVFLVNQILICLLIKNLFIALEKFTKAQHTFVLQINIQRYWQLIKIFLFNYFIAHILSICLNLMGQISVPGQEHWYSLKNIPINAPWYENYIWGYYWGINIMLTVGFGDIYASNYIQALILIFIQTFACIILAYNISEVSKILQSVTQVSQQKKIKFKIFNQLGQKYNFQENFKKNVVNHIERSIEQKHQLNYVQQNIIDELPQKIKLQVKREINKNVFQQAYFFKNLTKKTQNLLAEKVQKLFAHPEEIILKNQQNWKIFILRQGKMALTFKKGCSINNGTIIQRYDVSQINKPLLLSLKFIRKNTIAGDLKSIDFSILNTLQVDKFQQILKQYDNPMFEFYCSERDKTQFHFFDLQIFSCPICPHLRHQKTHCPKMHYIPIKQQIIYKKWIGNHGKYQHRNSFEFQRKHNKKIKSLKLYKQNIKYQMFYKQRSLKQIYEILPSLQFINNNQNFELNKKIDKCLFGIDTTIKLLKGEESIQQLVVDAAMNYKRYFSKYNPDNLTINLTMNTSNLINKSERLRPQNIANIL